MEREECEVLWTSQELKKREMDEYRLLKLIEKGFNSLPTEINTKKINVEQHTSISSFRRVKYQPPKVNINEREKVLENYLRNSKEKWRIGGKYLKNNFKVGITEFASHNQGFSAKKFNYNKNNTDFQVREMQFLTAGNQSGTSILSQLVIGNNEDPFKFKGFHFKIVLRKVIGDQSHIETCLKLLKDVGFLNYYECREFGNVLGNKHLIGKELLLEHWQEAIDLFLEKWLRSLKPSNLALACFVYTSSRDVLKAVSMIEENQMDLVPSKLLSSIKKHGDNLAEALNMGVPLDLRISHVRAYQCFIWNKIVSKRIAKFGSKVIVGDLVFPKGNNGQHNQQEVIFIDDGNIHKFTIYDVVLPLPGPETIYPANEIADWYIDLFRADGLSEKDFDQTSKIYGFDGVYRFMIIRPSDFKWEFVRYEYNPQKLISSDSKQLVRQPPVGVLGGAHLGLVLEFNLPAISFVSMALREILKVDRDKTESGTLGKQPSIDSLVEQPIPCPSSTSESTQPKEIPLEKTGTIQNLPPATKKPLKETQVKKEPAANERPASNTKDSPEDLQKNRSVLELSTSNVMPQLSVNECLQGTQTKCVKEELDIRRTRKSTLIKSCAEEPAEKKIKADPDAKPSKLSKFKSIIYIDLLSDEED